MHYFTTPGIIDPAAFTVMGLSVKDSDSAIGYFGTGLKYAIAVVLRLGGKITIRAGDCTYQFTPELGTFRNKPVTYIRCTNTNNESFFLPFTFDYGKNWEAWMAYRELYTNTLDESGWFSDSSELDTTTITVDLPCFDEVEENFTDYFLTEKDSFPDAVTSNNCTVFKHPAGAGRFYFKGIFVGNYPHLSNYSFNFTGTSPVRLTEDRTAPNWFNWPWIYRARMLLDAKHVGFIEEQLETNKLEFSEAYVDAFCRNMLSDTLDCEVFKERLQTRMKNLEKVHDFFTAVYLQANPGVTSYVKTEPPKAYLELQAAAMPLIPDLPFDTSLIPVHFIEATRINPNVKAFAYNHEVYLIPERLIQYSPEKLAAIILEEFYHVEYGYLDETRSFQSFLLEEIIRVGRNNASGISSSPQPEVPRPADLPCPD